jgi:hypothetical protein
MVAQQRKVPVVFDPTPYAQILCGPPFFEALQARSFSPIGLVLEPAVAHLEHAFPLVSLL